MYNEPDEMSDGKVPIGIDDNMIIVLDPSHSSYQQKIEQSVRKGFRHPLLASKFFEKDMTTPHLFLYQKYNHNYGKDIEEEEYLAMMKKVRFCIRNYRTTQNKPCRIHIILDEHALTYLHDYAKVFKFNVAGGKTEQREVSGIFLLYETTPNTFLVKVDEKSSNLGGAEQTSSTDTTGSFHTHPIEAYRKYKVCMAWPSVDDYTTFLSIYANGYGMFHILGTIEGIYVITISDKLMKEGRQKILENFSYYEKEIDKKYHKNYPTCNIDNNHENDKLWYKKVQAYLKWINSLKYFYVQFLFWADAKKPIAIHYKDINNNCMTGDEQIKFNDLLLRQQNSRKIKIDHSKHSNHSKHSHSH
jgi:hypothetical protein